MLNAEYLKCLAADFLAVSRRYADLRADELRLREHVGAAARVIGRLKRVVEAERTRGRDGQC